MSCMNAVDTNILIYACDNLAGARQETAIALLNHLDDAVIPWQVACEFDRARNLHLSDGVAFWDAMIYAACLETRVARVYSEDLPGKLFPEPEVVNPFA